MSEEDVAIVQVLLSVPDDQVGTRIAETVLEAGLCACVQTLGPVSSRYRWKGRIEQAQELLLFLKTRADRVEALETEILRHHPYEVPEILLFPASGGLEAYLEWVRRECGTSPAGSE
jgi:periplasmic divalent cation tolerance protein